PLFGTGAIIIPVGTFSAASGPIRFYVSQQLINSFPPVINGTAFTPGTTSSAFEEGSTYYPNGTGGNPFKIFYKVALPSPTPPPTPSKHPSRLRLAKGRFALNTNIAEMFGLWTPDNYGGYLREGMFPPLYTHTIGLLFPPQLVWNDEISKR